MSDDTLVEARRFDLRVTVVPWKGDHAVRPDDATSLVMAAIEINGELVAMTQDESAAWIDLDPFPTLWIDRPRAGAWDRLGITEDDWIDGSEEGGRVGVPLASIEIVTADGLTVSGGYRGTDGDDPVGL